MKFHETISGTAGTRAGLEQGMAGKRSALYQRRLRDIKEYVTVCDHAGFGHPEHHLQIEDMEATAAPSC